MSKGTKVGSKGEIVTLPLNAKVLLCRYWKGETQFSSVQSLSSVRLFAIPWTEEPGGYLLVVHGGAKIQTRLSD